MGSPLSKTGWITSFTNIELLKEIKIFGKYYVDFVAMVTT